MPFIVGVHAALLAEVEVPPSVIIVNLDTNDIKMPADRELPPLPRNQGGKLAAALAAHGDAFGHRPPRWREARLPLMDCAYRGGARPDEDDDADDAGRAARLAAWWAPDWDATRGAFFRLFVSLLLHYREFVLFPSKEVPHPPENFRRADFIASHPADARPFLAALCATQGFSSFIDDRVQPMGISGGASDIDVVFFDQSVDAKLNRSVRRLVKVETPFILSHDFDVARTVVALTPDVSGLPAGALYLYAPLPLLDASLYTPPRPLPSLDDVNARLAGIGHKLRRKPGVQGAAAVVSGSHAGNVYAAWFLVATAAIVPAPSAAPTRAALHARRMSIDHSGVGLGIPGHEATPPAHAAGGGAGAGALPPPSPAVARVDAVAAADASATHDLDVAFAVLGRMSAEGVPPDEVVYRSLLDACGRCGKVQRAYEVLQAMAAAGFSPDASVYSCLVCAAGGIACL